MAKKDNSTAKPQKFFFDVNNFNDDFEEVVEEVIPPPPTFSEAELDAARAEGFERGKREGLAEAAASREKFVAGIMDAIAKNFATLFQAEHLRAARYEAESVHLARAIFHKLFPALSARHGLDELRAVVARVLENRREEAAVVVEVHPDYVEDVENHIKHVLAGLHVAGQCTVAGNPALGPGDCRMQWDAGGAHRGARTLAAEIEKELDQVLADKAGLHDNEGSSDDPDNSVNTGEGDTP
jgi:flagellar assembly protein FliH